MILWPWRKGKLRWRKDAVGEWWSVGKRFYVRPWSGEWWESFDLEDLRPARMHRGRRAAMRACEIHAMQTKEG